MRFKLNRPFGAVAEFSRGDEFFDFLQFYSDSNRGCPIQGRILVDGITTIMLDRCLENGKQAFLLTHDPIYAEPEDEEEDSMDPMDDFNYVGSRHHY
jgi:hypothetical protein